MNKLDIQYMIGIAFIVAGAVWLVLVDNLWFLFLFAIGMAIVINTEQKF